MGLHEQFSQERAWRSGPGIQDGADIERAILGAAQITPKEREDRYMPFAAAVAYAREHQPDALHRSRIIRDLRTMVVDMCQDTEHAVKFFTAVGTPLDTYHGVDAFFEQDGAIVSIDVSLREKIKQKADVLLLVAFDKDGRPTILPTDLQKAASYIARKLNARSSQKAA